MTFTYCDARYDGTPVHRCLCHNRVMHNGAHKCVCGHAWGIDWNHLTYDQQRELLGLPAPTLHMQWAIRPGTWTIEIGNPEEAA